MFRICTTAALIVLAISAAQAGPAISVRYSDLDLSRSGDLRVLDSRIRQAAETVCASHFGWSIKLFHERWFENCVQHGIADTTVRIMAKNGEQTKIANK